MASSLSDTESVDTLGLIPSSPYTASLQPLKGQGQEPPKAAMLASDALMEQFERSQQYVARHPEDFSLERLSSLQASPPCRPDTSTLISSTPFSIERMHVTEHFECGQRYVAHASSIFPWSGSQPFMPIKHQAVQVGPLSVSTPVGAVLVLVDKVGHAL